MTRGPGPNPDRTVARIRASREFIDGCASRLIDAGFNTEMFEDDINGDRTFAVTHPAMPQNWQGQELKCEIQTPSDLSDDSHEQMRVYPADSSRETDVLRFTMLER